MWREEYNRLAVLLVAGLILVIILTGAVGYSYQVKKVTFKHNGEKIEISTTAETVQDFLKSQGIDFRARDEVSPELTEMVHDGMTISYLKSRPVIIFDGERERVVQTTKQTVGDILQNHAIRLNPEDEVVPALNATINSGDSITINRVTRKLVEEEKSLVYKMVKKSDMTLGEGEKKVLQNGKHGRAVYRYEVTYKNGKEIERKFIKADIIEDKQDQVVAVGTMGIVSRGGVTFQPRRALTMELTAYGPGVEHTGKNPDHPEYGITFTGTRAKEGHTIAVDPNVIPLGWWVYIEGFGFRRAEDTGSAVKGNRIDIYYDDDDFANGFGLKKGYTVYVIGPEKP